MDYNTLQVQEFHQRFDAIIHFLDNLSQLTESGELVPMGKLDHEIDALCKEVKNSAPEIAREMQPVMAQMIAKLDSLVDELSAYKQSLLTEEKD